MLSNYDRIYAEIKKGAEQFARQDGIQVNELLELVMGIVEIEDQHRIKSTNINQRVEQMISNTAVKHLVRTHS